MLIKTMNFRKLIAVALTATFALITAVSAEDTKPAAKILPPASTKTNVTFGVDIKPIFDRSCVKCHSGDKPKGKLKLDSLAGALKGGREGNDVIPGKSADSMLVHMVAQVSDDPMEWMPPAKNER
ncbi:MAG: c-type cytochrome domain-containing protein [Limisphaerales bacterium]